MNKIISVLLFLIISHSCWGNWIQTADLGAGNSTPKVALTAAGDAIAVWSTDDQRIHGAYLPLGSTEWIPTFEHKGVFPSLSVNEQGKGLLSWGDEENNLWFALISDQSQEWEVQCLRGNTDSPATVALTTDSRGNSYAAWRIENTFLGFAWFDNEEESQGAQFYHKELNGIYDLQFAMMQNGQVHLLWHDDNLCIHGFPVYLEMNYGGRDAYPLLKTDEDTFPHFKSVADKKRGVIVAWNDGTNIQSAVLDKNWKDPVQLSKKGAKDASEPQMAMDAQGNIVVVWLEFHKGLDLLHGAILKKGEKKWEDLRAFNIWPEISHIKGYRVINDVQLSMDAQGNAIALLKTEVPGNKRMLHKVVLAKGNDVWEKQESHVIEKDFYCDHHTATNSQGQMIVAWRCLDDSLQSIYWPSGHNERREEFLADQVSNCL